MKGSFFRLLDSRRGLLKIIDFEGKLTIRGWKIWILADNACLGVLGVLGCLGAWMLGCLCVRVLGVLGCLGARVLRSLGAWVLGRLGARALGPSERSSNRMLKRWSA